jgi:Flp pilus assembly protein TadG
MLKMRRQRQCPPLDSEPKGQSLAEFALTMPLLVALLVGIIALAWVGFAYVSISSAARMGARHMLSLNPADAPEDPDLFATADEEITYVVTTTMPFLNWRQAEIAILPEDTSERVYGTNVSVLITYTMDTPEIRIPYVIREGSFVLIPPLVLRASSQMRMW